ncbi:hypothetical protein [Phaeovulum sp.]|uniref:hypothetical protein n=1 Tax=Phaeovulum sp. TaxID=2934796 RepID=UPI0035687D0A
MSIWTSKASLALAFASALASAGCVMPFGGKDAPAMIALASDGPVIAGPVGFCVDPTQTHEEGENAFVLLGSCASLSRDAAVERPAARAVLTASVTPASPGAEPLAKSFKQIDSYFRSEAGRAALSRSGDAATVKVVRTVISDDLLLIELTDSAPSGANAVQARNWRGLMQIRGRIVSFTVLGLAEDPLNTTTMRMLANDFAAALRAANGLSPAI